jgi:signal transduction histidine kinase
MKAKKLSFLFFYFIAVQTGTLFSQELDSLTDYYVPLYTNAQNSDQLLRALTYFNDEKERSLSDKSFSRAAYCMVYIADADLKYESLYESEKVAVEALELLDSLPESTYTAPYKLSLYNHLGILKRRQNNYEKSIQYYKKSLTFTPKKFDSALAYNNISVARIYMEQYEKAKQRLLFAVDNFRELQDSIHIAMALNNMGLAKSKLNEKGGLEDLKEALEIRKKIADPAIYESYKNFVDYYKDRNDKEMALRYAKEGYQRSKTLGNLAYRNDAVRSLIALGEKGYGAELMAITDEIDSIEKQNTIKYAMAKYDYEDQLREKEQAELDKERAEANKTIYQLVGLSIFIIAIILFLYTRSRNKKNAIQKEFETEQRIARRLHDEVANEVFFMMNKIQREDIQTYELLDTLEEVYEKVRDISKANSEVSVAQDYDILIDDLIMKYANEDVNIIKDSIFDVSWDEISKDKKRVLYRVIQELMINMKKHSKADLVSFSFEKKLRNLEVKYADNGVGCNLEKGNGLQNVESRIKMVKGHITFDSKVNDGFYVNIIL